MEWLCRWLRHGAGESESRRHLSSWQAGDQHLGAAGAGGGAGAAGVRGSVPGLERGSAGLESCQFLKYPTLCPFLASSPACSEALRLAAPTLA